MGTQSRFNEFLKPSKEEMNHIPGKIIFNNPGYLGFVPSIRAENLHSRTYGDLTRIVKANHELREAEGDQFYGMVKDSQNGSKLERDIKEKLLKDKNRLQ